MRQDAVPRALVASVLLLVLGTSLSYYGYAQRAQMVTLTQVDSFTLTSTRTVTSVSTESFTAVSKSAIEGISTVIKLNGLMEGYCAVWNLLIIYWGKGSKHISFNSDGPVDFWLVNGHDVPARTPGWGPIGGYPTHECNPVSLTKAIAHKYQTTVYESTVDVPTVSTYALVFVSRSKTPLSVAVNIDEGIAQTVVTVTRVHTEYSLQEVNIPTETIILSTRPAGFGTLLLVGIILAAIGVGAGSLAVSGRREHAQPETLKR